MRGEQSIRHGLYPDMKYTTSNDDSVTVSVRSGILKVCCVLTMKILV